MSGANPRFCVHIPNPSPPVVATPVKWRAQSTVIAPLRGRSTLVSGASHRGNGNRYRLAESSELRSGAHRGS